MKDIDIEVKDILNVFSADIQEIVRQEIDKSAEEIVADLKSNPKIPKKTGEYRKGFRLRKSLGGYNYKVTVYNEKYQLTHLLEHGHIIPGTGRRTKAYPHWEEAQALAEKIPDRITKRIGEYD